MKERYNFKNLQGLKFGRWLVLERKPNQIVQGHHYIVWLCRCDCGVEKEVRSTTLLRNKSKSCGCYLKEMASKRNIKEDSAFRQRLSIYKQNAKKCNRIFELTDKQAKDIMSSVCFYCGDEPHNYIESRAGELFFYNGIDRVDSSKGYIFENCVPCCTKCNRMKSDYDQEDFINHCLKIVNYSLGGK